jgi:hypothetical protein
MNCFLTKFRIIAGSALAAALITGCVNDSPVNVPVNAKHSMVSAKKAKSLAFKSNAVKYKNNGIKPGTGREGSATLEVRALIAKDGSTAIEATTGSLENGTQFGNIDKAQLKVLVGTSSTKNFNNLKAGGYWSTVLNPGPSAGAKVQVQANISGIDGKRTNVVTAVATAARRPDISVEALNGLTESAPGVPVTFTALLAELNGDVGARTNCVLSVNGATVDQAVGIWVDAGSSVSCMFTHTFAAAGNYTVSVSATSVNPGDWDLANNTRSASIEIAEEDVGGLGAGALQAASYDFDESRNDVGISGTPYLYKTTQKVRYSYIVMYGGLYGETTPIVDLESIDSKVRVDGVVVHTGTLFPNNASQYDNGDYYSNCKTFDGMVSSTSSGDTSIYIHSGEWAQVCNYGQYGNPSSKQLNYQYQKVDGEVLYFSEQSSTNVYGDSYHGSWVQIYNYGTGDMWDIVAGSAVRVGVTFHGVGGESYAFDRTVDVVDQSPQINYAYENTYEDWYWGATIHQVHTRTGTYLFGYGNW